MKGLDMYIVTLEELDQRTKVWITTCRTFEGEDLAEDFMKYQLELTSYGLVRNIHIFKATEIPYKHTVTVELDIDWR